MRLKRQASRREEGHELVQGEPLGQHAVTQVGGESDVSGERQVDISQRYLGSR